MVRSEPSAPGSGSAGTPPLDKFRLPGDSRRVAGRATEIEQALRAFAAGDPAPALDRLAPDFSLFPRPLEPGVREQYHGLDGLMTYLANWFGQWDLYEIEPIRSYENADSVLVVIRERGTLKSADLRLEEDFAHSFTYRGDQVVEWRMYDSLEQAATALGIDLAA